MERNKYWELDLVDFILSRVDTPLVWGKSDCCLFVVDAIKSFTGVDIAGEFRGRYKTRKGAFESMSLFTDGFSVQATMGKLARRFGMRSRDGKVLPGDMVLHKAEACDPVAWKMSNGITVGVGVDNGAIASQGKHGLMLNSKPEVVEIWRL